MKEKMKPMLIGGSIGVATGVGTAFLMGKKDAKNMIMFGIIGLAAGAAVGFFMSKDEQKSNAKGDDPSCCNATTQKCCRITSPTF